MKPSTYRIFTLLFCIALFYSCSKDDIQDDGEMTIIKGVLMSPNGETPIPNATIFVPEDVSDYIDTNGSGMKTTNNDSGCQTPQIPYIGYTCSKFDGRFELQIPKTDAYSIMVIFQSGAFSFTQELLLTGETSDFGVIPLESNSANIAVVTGHYDRMQDILGKLGFGTINTDEDDYWGYGQLVLGTETFDLFDGDGSLDNSYPAINELFEDNDGDGQIDLHNYDIVFINCGASETPLTGRPSGIVPEHNDFHRHKMNNAPFSQELTDELQAFVEAGGVLYCTDWAYDYVEQTFPSKIDFYGSDDTPADQPEDPNAAEFGEGGIEVQGEILENSLGTWLTGVTCNESEVCLDDEGGVHITSFLSSWAM